MTNTRKVSRMTKMMKSLQTKEIAGQAQEHKPVIPATDEAEVGGELSSSPGWATQEDSLTRGLKK